MCRNSDNAPVVLNLQTYFQNVIIRFVYLFQMANEIF